MRFGFWPAQPPPSAEKEITAQTNRAILIPTSPFPGKFPLPIPQSRLACDRNRIRTRLFRPSSLASRLAKCLER